MKLRLTIWIFDFNVAICSVSPIKIIKSISSRVYKICAVSFLFTLPLLLHAQNNCELKKNKDNIKVFSCITADSKFKAVRAEFNINASIDQYIAIVLDVEGYKDWHYRVVNPRILTKINEYELIYYTQLKAPWPVSNRDLILQLNLEKDINTNVLTVTLNSLPDYLPEVEDVIRVPESYSRITLTPIDNSTTKVDYFIKVDPGGEIPPWLVNLFSTQAPYETFKNLKEKIARELNNKAGVSSVATGN
jgi:hypothetical protein